MAKVLLNQIQPPSWTTVSFCLFSIFGGCLLHPHSEDAPCCDDEGPI